MPLTPDEIALVAKLSDIHANSGLEIFEVATIIKKAGLPILSGVTTVYIQSMYALMFDSNPDPVRFARQWTQTQGVSRWQDWKDKK